MIDVLCVTTKLCVGGVQTFLINNAEPLLKYGVRLNFAVQTDQKQCYDDYIMSLGCKIFHITSLGASKIRFMKDIRSILKLNQSIRIIHTHQNFANLYSLLAAHSLSVRISHAHSSYPSTSLFNRIIKWGFKQSLPLIATNYWACSEKAAQWLYGKHSHSKKCEIINNAINTSRFKFNPEVRNRVRATLNLSDKTVLCHVGTFGEAKNHMFLLDVFKSYHDANPLSHLLLCGDGPLRKPIEDKIEKLGLNDSVTLLGNVINAEEYLSASDIFVFPSIFEGFALSVLEAQTSGIPCIASSAVPEQCIINPNAVRISGYNVADYLAAIDSISKVSFDREQGADQIISAGLDIETEAERIAKLYKESLEIR